MLTKYYIHLFKGCYEESGHKGPAYANYEVERWDCPHDLTSDPRGSGITVTGVSSSNRRGAETRPVNMNIIWIIRVW